MDINHSGDSDMDFLKKKREECCAGRLHSLSSVHSPIRITRLPILVKVKIIVAAIDARGK